MENIFNQFGFTGNNALDALIAMNLIPLIITYCKNISELISGIFLAIYNFLFDYVKKRFERIIIGDCVLIIFIKDSDILFSFINNNIFKTNMPSDIKNKSSYILMFLNMLKKTNTSKNEKGEYVPYFKYWRQKHHKSVNLIMNYKSCEQMLEHIECDYTHMTKIETKYFEYNNFGFIIKLCKKDNEYNIKINIIDYSKKVNLNKNKNEYIEILEKFLIEKFDMKEKIGYIYSVLLDFNLGLYISRQLPGKSYNLSNNLIDSLNVTEKSHKYKLLSECTQFSNSTYDYSSYLDLVNNSDTNNDGFAILKKHIDKINTIGAEYANCIRFDDMHLYFESRGYDNIGNYIYNLHILSSGKTLSKKQILCLINELIRRLNNKNKPIDTTKNNASLYRLNDDGKWTATEIDKRSIDTIYLPHETKKKITAEIELFITKEKLYKEYQIPYKKGILFYGPPGTGKTSIVKSLAFEYQLNIYMLDINSEHVNDNNIVDILNSIGGTSNKILLFEDVDSAFSDKEELKYQDRSSNVQQINFSKLINDSKIVESKNVNDVNKTDKGGNGTNIKKNLNIINNNVKKYLTYSGLLNALDGVLSNQTGVITIMTTNYIEKLGEAFLRPGRIDNKFELKECNHEQIRDMLTTFITKRNNLYSQLNTKYVEINEHLLADKIENFVYNVTNSYGQSNIKPCHLQYYILKYIDELELIFDNYYELINNENL